MRRSSRDSLGRKVSFLLVACLPLLAACGDSSSSPAPAAQGITFSSVSAPATDAEKRAVQVADTAIIDGTAYDLAFHTILRSGQQPAGGGTFGQLYDIDGNPLTAADNSLWISNSNDFSSLLIGADNNLYMVSHFEESPGGMYVTELSQNADNGALTAVRTRNLDFSDFGGGWVHCAGSVTPWGTHLGSEEYEPDARQVDPVTGAMPSYENSQAYYFGLDPNDNTAGAFDAINVYDYGWQIEVKVDDFDTVTPTKHYAMGRVAHELAYVMPDKKTAYISDDGTNVGLFRFVADTEEDLSAGTLYVAVWNQTGAANGGTADIDWISLGHATDAEIRAYLDNNTTFADIFDAVPPNVDNTCPANYTAVQTTYAQETPEKLECLMVQPGMDNAAVSRLETRRYAAMLGGTTEFRKMEGITFDPDNKVLYIAMSEVNSGMLDNDASKDKGGPNDIRLPLNTCGIVYGLSLDNNWVATEMHGVVQGIPRVITFGATADNPYDPLGPFAKNKCDLDGIANPDNISFMPGHKTLLIGEDTGDGHQNDAVWAYNVTSKTLTRIETTPYGSETTGVYFYPNIHGWAYIMSVIQHPYGESDSDQTTPGSEATRGYTGYIGPLPAMN